MDSRKLLRKKRDRRKNRNRARIIGAGNRPRLSVFRSNRLFSVQLIDDINHKTIASASTKNLEGAAGKKTKTEQAKMLGELVAKKIIELKTDAVVFDRGSYRFHGRVKAFVEGLKSAGIKI